MDTEKFIECIKKYPILYNPKHKDFKNYQKKQKTWEVVAIEMNETSDVVRTRWKGLKDGYTKYKKQKKCYSDWCWGSHMLFFDGYLKQKAKQRYENTFLHVELSSASLPSPTQSSLLPEVSVKSEPYILDSVDNIAPISGSGGIQQSQHSPRESESRSRAASTETEEDLENAIGIFPKRTKRTDATDYLFMSYAETFKKFSVRTQASVKVQMAKLFAEAELQEYEINQ